MHKANSSEWGVAFYFVWVYDYPAHLIMVSIMSKAKTYIADVYTEGKTQIIKLPKAFHINDGKVYIRQIDDNKHNTIEVTPKKRTIKEFLESNIKCTDDFFSPERSDPSKERDYSGW